MTSLLGSASPRRRQLGLLVLTLGSSLAFGAVHAQAPGGTIRTRGKVATTSQTPRRDR